MSSNSSLLTSDCWQMVDLGRHRGPDGSQVVFAGEERFEHDAQVSISRSWSVMGHSRLTILDLSDASNQPFLSDEGRYSLVFNGEIYNYLELKNELQQGGVVFETTGDTEVLMKALITWGLDAIRKLRGMFAFAFADARDKTVLLARDRYGIKPLHVFRTPSTCFFASEIKQFTALEGWNPRVNEELALQFLLYGVTDHRQETLFCDVERVLPGHYILLTLDALNEYRQMPWYKEELTEPYKSFSEAVENFRDAFIDSVQVHLRSDVPIGSCLSGGLDSSSIVGVATTLLQDQTFHTFTATSELKKIDETRYVEAVVGKTNCTPHFVEPTSKQLLDDLESLAWHQDEPFGGTSIYAQWCVFRLVQGEGIKVVLDGQGADEQLAGYNGFLVTYLVSLLRRGKLITFCREYRKIQSAGRVDIKSFAQFLLYQILPTSSIRKLGKALGIASQNGGNWINAQILDRHDIGDPFHDKNGVPKNVSELSRQMINISNLPMLLRFEDRNSMAHSVESRVPFVDNRVFGAVSGLTDSHLIDGDYTKRVLRDGLAEYLPDVIRFRKDKIGFQTAEEVWMRENPEEYKRLVFESITQCGRFFSKDTQSLCYQVIEGETPFSPVPWRVISFGAWAKAFNVQGC